MPRKSFHEHRIEEVRVASAILQEAKKKEIGKAVIYLKDNAHTILSVERSKLTKKIEQLKKMGAIIKQIL